MEAKYTKGEWKVKGTPHYFEPKSSRIEIQSKSSQGWIAKIQTNGVIRHKEGLANAKLIASAPEMLEVLETIENDANQIPEWLWLRIKNVIKKATE